MSTKPYKYAALVTAAGASSRMQGTHKATLPWHGRPLVQHQCETLLACGFETVVVVVGASEPQLRACLPRMRGVTVVANPDWAQGRSSSLAAGARKVPADTQWLLVTAVDQPLFIENTSALRYACVECDKPLVIAKDATTGRGGHPIVLGASLWPQLLEAPQLAQGMRTLVAPHRADACEVPCGRPTRLDLNTPESYASAHARYGVGPG